jgi:MOSC domain-containing protein YiiM
MIPMNKSNYYGSVKAVCQKSDPGLPKIEVEAAHLIENFGLVGDYHAGQFVRHRYLAQKDPTQLNHRQVLLADTSIYADISAQGIMLKPGMLGENIIVDGIKVMTLPVGTQLELGEVLLELTEVRDPCNQLNEMHPRLLEAVTSKIDGQACPNAGMMARILKGGWVHPGNPVIVRVKPDEMSS